MSAMFAFADLPRCDERLGVGEGDAIDRDGDITDIFDFIGGLGLRIHLV